MKKQNQSTEKQFGTIVGVDLGDRKHQVCVTGKDGSIISEASVANTSEAITKLAEDHPDALFAIEVGTHSPWISRLLEGKSCHVVVANARKLRAIYENERKCDEQDARMLAKLARVDQSLLSPVHHGTEADQRHRLALTLRDTLVRQRVAAISSLRFSLKSLGLRLPGCSTACFVKKCRASLEDPELVATAEPLLKVLEELTSQIKELDRKIREVASVHHPETALLEQIAGVGPVTSLSFVLAVGDPGRFADPRQVGAYFGLVPRRDQSGQSDKELPISKTGNKEMRRLLTQAAHYILGPFGPDTDLRRHGLKLAARGGKAAKRKAVVAVARKLAVLMLILWRDQSSYKPLKNNAPNRALPTRPGREKDLNPKKRATAAA
jgi:transposase